MDAFPEQARVYFKTPNRNREVIPGGAVKIPKKTHGSGSVKAHPMNDTVEVRITRSKGRKDGDCVDC